MKVFDLRQLREILERLNPPTECMIVTFSIGKSRDKIGKLQVEVSCLKRAVPENPEADLFWVRSNQKDLFEDCLDLESEALEIEKVAYLIQDYLRRKLSQTKEAFVSVKFLLDGPHAIEPVYQVSMEELYPFRAEFARHRDDSPCGC